MTVPAHLIILNTTKFGENSIIAHAITKEWGRRGFIVRIGRKAQMAHFLPLNITEAEVSENTKSSLWRASGFRAASPLSGIRGNMYKNSMTLFMSEVLWRTVKDEAFEDGLYEWLERSVLALDAIESDFSNFHLRFLLEFASTLGFSPETEDLAPFCRHLGETEALLRSSFGEAMLLPLTGEKRNEIAEDILRYLEHHTDSSINIRSLKVLRELFR